MKWKITRNNLPVKTKSIPVYEFKKFRSGLIEAINDGLRPVGFFGSRSGKSLVLYAVLASDEDSTLSIASSDMTGCSSYPSLTPLCPKLWNFENELYEEFGIKPEGHPWIRGVRFGHDRFNSESGMSSFPFFTMAGEEVHEVAVGPIHAGVIEPGHFRFMCHGENVYHLEIQLGYQHRGVESLMVNNRLKYPVHLAESIAGDSVIAHAGTFARAVEGLGAVKITGRAESIRGIALEMERTAIHLGDLGALAGDVAYLIGNSVYGAIRTVVINSLLMICGSRFGRGLIRPGGVAFDIDEDLSGEIVKILEKAGDDVERMSERMFESPSVLSRFENTGKVSGETAEKIGMVGLSARASGLALDIRSDHPYGIFRNYPVHKVTMDSGDVFARAYMRYVEIKQSLQFIIEQLDVLKEKQPVLLPPGKTGPEQFIVSMTEGWRGEVVHAAITGKKGEIKRYKIKDPSFNNWFGLAQAVRGNGISDFPLCNKSFNLSYCGHDL